MMEEKSNRKCKRDSMVFILYYIIRIEKFLYSETSPTDYLSKEIASSKATVHKSTDLSLFHSELLCLLSSKLTSSVETNLTVGRRWFS